MLKNIPTLLKAAKSWRPEKNISTAADVLPLTFPKTKIATVNFQMAVLGKNCRS